MKKALPTENLDKDGNLQTISFTDPKTGDHIIDALWDPRDEQTSENRALFRKWAYRQLEQQGYEVIK